VLAKALHDAMAPSWRPSSAAARLVLDTGGDAGLLRAARARLHQTTGDRIGTAQARALEALTLAIDELSAHPWGKSAKH